MIVIESGQSREFKDLLVAGLGAMGEVENLSSTQDQPSDEGVRGLIFISRYQEYRACTAF